MDENGISTIKEPENVVAWHGDWPSGQQHLERGVLSILTALVMLQGTWSSPMFVFPRVHFKDHFIQDGPTGCIGAAKSSGWILEEHFTHFLQYSQHHIRASKNTRVLLILDDHSSHLCQRNWFLQSQWDRNVIFPTALLTQAAATGPKCFSALSKGKSIPFATHGWDLTQVCR